MTIETPGGAPTQQVVFVEKKGNGLAVAALVLGIVGTVFGLVPLTFMVALICGVLALVFGVVAWRAWRKDNSRGRRGMSIAGFVLGVAAIGLGIVGAVIVSDAVDDLNQTINELTTPAK